MREHIVAASNAMKKGNWKQSRDYILNIKVIIINCVGATNSRLGICLLMLMK